MEEMNSFPDNIQIYQEGCLEGVTKTMECHGVCDDMRFLKNP